MPPPLDPDENVEHERRRSDRREVAVAGLLNESGQILMVRTRRLPGRWQPVGGELHADEEDPARALTREIREEVGVSLPASVLQHVLDVPSDFGRGTVHFFRADVKNISIKRAPGEILDYRWLPVEMALRLPVFPATATFLRKLAESTA